MKVIVTCGSSGNRQIGVSACRILFELQQVEIKNTQKDTCFTSFVI